MANTRSVAAIVLAGMLCVACGRSDGKQSPPRDGTVGTTGRAPTGAMTVATTLRATERPVFVTRDREGERLWALTKQFYQKRGDASVWIEGRKPRPQMDELIQVLQRTDREGLDPALYNASVLTARRAEAGQGFLSMKGFDEAEAANLDVWLTYLYLQYSSDLTNGVANLAHLDPKWQIRDKKTDSLAQLEQALEQNQVARSLDGLTPRHAQYPGLRDAFAKYREIEQRGGCNPQSHADEVQARPARPRSAARAPLAVTGDYGNCERPGRPTAPSCRSGQALPAPPRPRTGRRGQRRHLTQLNVPAGRHPADSLNLERWRWLPAGSASGTSSASRCRLEVWDRGKVPCRCASSSARRTRPRRSSTTT